MTGLTRTQWLCPPLLPAPAGQNPHGFIRPLFLPIAKLSTYPPPGSNHTLAHVAHAADGTKGRVAPAIWKAALAKPPSCTTMVNCFSPQVRQLATVRRQLRLAPLGSQRHEEFHPWRHALAGNRFRSARVRNELEITPLGLPRKLIALRIRLLRLQEIHGDQHDAQTAASRRTTCCSHRARGRDMGGVVVYLGGARLHSGPTTMFRAPSRPRPRGDAARAPRGVAPPS